MKLHDHLMQTLTLLLEHAGEVLGAPPDMNEPQVEVTQRIVNRNEDYTMENDQISRRSLLKGGGTVLAGLTALQKRSRAGVRECRR